MWKCVVMTSYCIDCAIFHLVNASCRYRICCKQKWTRALTVPDLAFSSSCKWLNKASRGMSHPELHLESIQSSHSMKPTEDGSSWDTTPTLPGSWSTYVRCWKHLENQESRGGQRREEKSSREVKSGLAYIKLCISQVFVSILVITEKIHVIILS